MLGESSRNAVGVKTPVSVVIPSVEGGDRLVGLASALLRGAAAPTEVVIADNGLAEGTVDRLRGTGVKIVPMGRNRGFGAAVNRAVRAAEGACS